MKKILNFKFILGKSFDNTELSDGLIKNNTQEKYLYNKLRSQSDKVSLGYVFRELLWKTNIWKNKNLRNFLDLKKPQIIFTTVFKFPYAHLVLRFVLKQTGAKLVLFHSDDYFYKSKKESMLMKLTRSIEQKNILRTIELSDLNYCISEEQLIEYKKYTNKPLKLLFKGEDFMKEPNFQKSYDKDSLVITYIGSLQYGRWITLGELSKAIKAINQKYDKKIIELNIYSQYQPTDNELKHITSNGYTNYLGKLDNKNVKANLSSSNIVLHVESFNEQEKNRTKLSFSTKIVDCLNSGSCILAIGDSEAASIKYLEKNDAAIIINKVDKIEETLEGIINNPEKILRYSQNSWELGKKNHDIKKIRSNLNKDLLSLLGE